MLFLDLFVVFIVSCLGFQSPGQAALLDEKRLLDHYQKESQPLLKGKMPQRILFKESKGDANLTREAIRFLNIIQSAQLRNYMHLVEAMRDYENVIRATYPVYIHGAFLLACADVMQKFSVVHNPEWLSFSESQSLFDIQKDFAQIAEVLTQEAQKQTVPSKINLLSVYKRLLKNLSKPATIHLIGPKNFKKQNDFISATTTYPQHQVDYHPLSFPFSKDEFKGGIAKIIQEKKGDNGNRLHIVFIIPWKDKMMPYFVQDGLLALHKNGVAVVFKDVNTVSWHEDGIKKPFKKTTSSSPLKTSQKSGSCPQAVIKSTAMKKEAVKKEDIKKEVAGKSEGQRKDPGNLPPHAIVQKNKDRLTAQIKMHRQGHLKKIQGRRPRNASQGSLVSEAKKNNAWSYPG